MATTEPRTKAANDLLDDLVNDHEAPSYHVIERVRSGLLATEAEMTITPEALAHAGHYLYCFRDAAWHANPDVRKAWPGHFTTMDAERRYAERLLAAALRDSLPVTGYHA